MLCYGLLVGAGVATGSAMAAQAGLAHWFVRRRSLALSVLYSAGAIGGFVAAPLLNRLIETTGTWRAGWWLLAALSAVGAGIALIFVRERPEDVGVLGQVILFAICVGIGFGGAVVLFFIRRPGMVG